MSTYDPNAGASPPKPDKSKLFGWFGAKEAEVGCDLMSCPVCHQSKWFVGEYFVRIEGFARTQVQGVFYPAVIMVCEVCGFVRLHAAVTVGQLSPQQG